MKKGSVMHDILKEIKKNVFLKSFLTLLIFTYVFGQFLSITQTQAAGVYNATWAFGQFDSTAVYTPRFDTGTPGNGGGSTVHDGFSSPYGVELDLVNHRLFVMDAGYSRVLVFNLNAGNNQLIDYVADAVIGPSNFTSGGFNEGDDEEFGFQPLDAAYDSTHNYLYVADGGKNRVLVFDVATISNGEDPVFVLGQPNMTVKTSGLTDSKMSSPEYLNYDTSNNLLYVADTGNNRVLVFDISDGVTTGEAAINVLGQPDFTTNTPDLDDDSLENPWDITFDGTGDTLFIADRGNNRILVFNVGDGITDGEPAVFVLGQAGFVTEATALTASGLNDPISVEYDDDNDYLFVGDTANNRVLVFNLADGIVNGEDAFRVLGQEDFTTVDNSTISASSVFNAHGISYDPGNKYIYISDRDRNRLLIFDGTTISNGEDAIDVLGQVTKSYTYASTPNYLSSNINAGVVFEGGTSTGNISPVGFDDPHSVALDPINHKLYVSDRDNHRISIFNLDTDNTLIDSTADSAIGASSASVVGSDTSFNPTYLAISPEDGYLFVTDSGNQRVSIYSIPANTLYGSISLVSDPVTLTFDDDLGEFVLIPGPLIATGLAYDSASDLLYIADAYARVLVFPAPFGSPSHVIGAPDFTTSGGGTTLLGGVFGLAVDSVHNRLFVADSNARVLVFDTSSLANGMGASYVLYQDNEAGNAAGADNASLSATLGGIFYDEENEFLYISDTGNNRVVAVDADHSDTTNGRESLFVLGQDDFNSSGAVISQSGLSTPMGISFDPDISRLYVTDSTAHRVMMYDFLRITTTSLDAGTVGSVYSKALSVSGEVGTVTYELVSGSLPAGITLSSGGVLSGTPTVAGTYSPVFRAIDTVSGIPFRSQSAPFSLVVSSSGGGGGGSNNDAPLVSITYPINNASFTSGTSVPVTINASDSDGTISKVKLYVNGVEVVELTSSPYMYILTTLSDGSHTLTAKAYDNDNRSADSLPVTITISDSVPPPDTCATNPSLCTPPPDPGCQGLLNSVLCIIIDTYTDTVNVVKDTGTQVKYIIESPFGDVLTKSISTVGLVFSTIFTLLPILFLNPLSFSELALLPLRLWSLLLTVFGLKKRNRQWGTVYDSVTKRPLDPVYVVLQDVEGKEIATSITDIDGRYGFLVEPGKYRILPTKTHYSFPSLKMIGKTRDEIYLDLYFGYVFEVKNTGEVITKNIPMDPEGFDWNEFTKSEQKLTRFYSKRDLIYTRIADIAFSVGFSIATLAILSAPKTYNIIIFSLYVLLLVVRELGIRQKKSGRIVRKGTDIPIAFAIVRVFDQKTNVEILHRVTNQIGKYFCLIQNGNYYVTIETKNPDETYTKVFTSNPITVTKGIINEKFQV